MAKKNNKIYSQFSRRIAWALMILIGGLFFQITAIAHAQTLVLKNSQSTYKLMEYLEFLEDPDGILTYEAVTADDNQHKFKPRIGKHRNFGFTNSVFWARLKLENRSSENTWLVWLHNSGGRTVDYLDLYLPRPGGGFDLFREGESVPQSQSTLKDNNIPSFQVSIVPGDSKTLYFRIKDEGLLFFPLELYNLQSIRSVAKEGFWWILLLGAYLFFIIYNLLLYTSLRDPVYLFFSLMLTGFPISFMMGALNQFSPDLSVWWINRIKQQDFLLYSISLLLLTKYYFQLNDPKSMIHRWVIALIACCVCIHASAFFVPHLVFLKAQSWLTVVLRLSVLTISIIRWRQGFIAGRYFTLAVGITCLLFSFREFQRLDLLFVPSGTHRYITMAYLFFELTCYSIALIDRHNLLNRQAMAAQKLAVKSMQQAEKAKDEFLANTSHELRTPLHGIIGLCEDLLERCKTGIKSGWESDLNIVVHSARRLSSLIDDIMDVTHIKQGRLQLSIKPVDFSSILSLVTALCRPMIAPQKKVHLKSNLPAGLPLIEADEDRLQQILINLIKNAAKFTQEGSIEISARVNGTFLEICVQDTGIGIPEEKQAIIFDRFTQLDGSMDREHGGAGLGLAITRQLVELHGGRIWIESQKDEGSRFSFTMPLANDTSGISPPATRVEPPADSNMLLYSPLPSHWPFAVPDNEEGARILIVDDEQISLHVLHNHLQTAGYRVTAAKDAFEAESQLSVHSFDLIVLDIMMPGMNGYEFCRNLRNEFNPTELPVIMLTARARTEDLAKGFDCGANDYLTKPVSRLELLARIQSSLKLKKLADLLRENKVLKDEIIRRKAAENQLYTANRQLSGLLDLWEAALMIADKQNQILYFNHCAEQLLGYPPHEIVNRSLSVIFPDAPKSISKPKNTFDIARVTTEKTKSIRLQLTARTSGSETLQLEVIVTPMLIHGDEAYALICRHVQRPAEKTQANLSARDDIQALTGHHQKIQAMQGAFNSALCHLQMEGQKLKNELKHIDQAMNEAFEQLPEKELEQHFRQGVVDLMNAALTCWIESTGKDKIALAEQSGLWHTYLDASTYKARTLDKYLDAKKLPQKPRWKTALKTVDFVLQHSNETVPSQKILNGSLVQFKSILKVKEMV